MSHIARDVDRPGSKRDVLARPSGGARGRGTSLPSGVRPPRHVQVEGFCHVSRDIHEQYDLRGLLARPLGGARGRGTCLPSGVRPPRHRVQRRLRVRHKVHVGPPALAAATWVTACGWRFGRYGLARPSAPADAWCAKCYRA